MLIIDTGFWLALANPKDTYHSIAVNYLEKIDESCVRLIQLLRKPAIYC
jgi:predicted nucleic acid-binding protein